ncbi:MAG: ATP-binding cassette domain-containing protein [Bacteroidetes bacterium]|nr:MAG: ATP-binding cassette domain-containing protein [Bacteroidota bacterium]
MLQCEPLQFAYTRDTVFRFPALHCAAARTLLILGQSGVGKTTLLHLLGGLLRPQSGNIYIHNEEITALDNPRLDAFRGRHIGLVFQRPHFVASLSVTENLLLAPYFASLPQSRRRAHELLDSLGIGDKRDKLPQRLSIGEQQRAAIARALMNSPRLILADEPTSALDDIHAQSVATLLENSAREAGAALVIVTHDSRLMSRFDQQVILVKEPHL